jgi:hypothetical protein
MGVTASVIRSVATPGYGRVVMETSDGRAFAADLSSFAAVTCFPRTLDEWNVVAPDADGFALVWKSGFEVHLDQVIGLADHVESVGYPIRAALRAEQGKGTLHRAA